MLPSVRAGFLPTLLLPSFFFTSLYLFTFILVISFPLFYPYRHSTFFNISDFISLPLPFVLFYFPSSDLLVFFLVILFLLPSFCPSLLLLIVPSTSTSPSSLFIDLHFCFFSALLWVPHFLSSLFQFSSPSLSSLISFKPSFLLSFFQSLLSSIIPLFLLSFLPFLPPSLLTQTYHTAFLPVSCCPSIATTYLSPFFLLDFLTFLASLPLFSLHPASPIINLPHYDLLSFPPNLPSPSFLPCLCPSLLPLPLPAVSLVSK